MVHTYIQPKLKIQVSLKYTSILPYITQLIIQFVLLCVQTVFISLWLCTVLQAPVTTAQYPGI